MNTVKDIINELEKRKEFIDWRKLHKASFLAHVFVLLDEQNKDIFQLGFYNPENKKMSTFIMSKTNVEFIADQDIVESGNEIKELSVSKCNISIDDALAAGRKVKDEFYKNEFVLKHFFIIQEFEGVPIYNITYFTQSLKAVNIKISAVDNRVLKHSGEVLMKMGK